MKQKILVADDEQDILDLLKYNLVKEGFEVIAAKNGIDALSQAKKNPDLILLDVMMPELDGWEVVRQLKAAKATATIPVIFLTAKSSDIDEVLGLELGAEDYIVKPISIPKLIARIKSSLRKNKSRKGMLQEGSEELRHGVLEISSSQFKVFIKKREVFFPRKEFEVLRYLVQHRGKVITRETLLMNVWGSDVFVVDRTVDVHIRKIREKLGSYANYIETIKGVGYRMQDLD